MKLPLVMLILGFVACVVAAEAAEVKPVQFAPAPQMLTTQCRSLGQFFFWVADYRDVKADMNLVKKKIDDDALHVQYVQSQIDVIYASNDSPKVIAEKFYAMCTAPRSGA